MTGALRSGLRPRCRDHRRHGSRIIGDWVSAVPRGVGSSLRERLVHPRYAPRKAPITLAVKDKPTVTVSGFCAANALQANS